MKIKSFIISCIALVASTPAHAQIISQSPQPEVITDAGNEVETLTRRERIGISGTLIKIPRSGALLFAGFDRNTDYQIDRSEVAQGINHAFQVADKDGSGTLSLVELEAWRLAALGSTHAAPGNYAFAPNFARTVSLETFTEVLQHVADVLDTNDQGEKDGMISMADLLKDYRPTRAVQKGDNCAARLREERRRIEQQCRSRRRF